MASMMITMAEGVVYKGLQRLGPVQWRTLVNGSPVYSYYVGFVHQLFLFPALAVFSLWPVLQGAMPFSDWLHSSFSEGGGAPCGCQAFHVALLSYWLKDCLFVPMSTEIWLHHAVSLVAVITSMAGGLPKSAGVFTLGSLALELGSGVNTCCEVSWLTFRSMLPFMVVSNCFSAALVCWYAYGFGDLGTDLRWWMAAACGTAMCIMRQRAFNSRIRQSESRGLGGCCPADVARRNAD